MPAYRIGVIGLGDISTVYLNNLKKYPATVELYACACRTPERAEEKRRQFGFQKAYASAEELLADPEVDILLNLTTPDAHYRYNLAAVKAGKHVYSEKPLAATYAEGRKILAEAEKHGVRVGCAPDTFMGSRLQTFRRLMDEGVTGEIVGGIANCVSHGWEWYHPNPNYFYQPGAGPVLDIGPYYLTALLSLLGPVETVAAMGSQPQKTREIYGGLRKGGTIQVHPDVMTHILAVLRFRSGAVVSFNMSWDAWDSELPRLELYGTKATLCMAEPDPNAGPNVFGGDTLFKTAEAYRWRSMPRREAESALPWRTADVRHDHASVSYVENSRGIGLVDLAEAVRDNRPARAGGEMSLHMLEVSEGILRAARENRYLYMESDFTRPAAMPQRNSD